MLEPFKASDALSLGVELELQLVSKLDYDLAPFAEDLLNLVEKRKHPGDIKPEITRSMIEMSTGVQHRHDALVAELRELRDIMVDSAETLNIGIAGGGTHPFQHWATQRIYSGERFDYISDLYGYLAKQFTIFGQHVHVGVPSPDEALFLLHCLSRYVPHFIALSASSPFVQGIDTGFSSARLNSVFAFPLSGRAPLVDSWSDFNDYFDKMTATGVVKTMKDFYWDIRPKPEFGTIEVRVCDTPLTVDHAADIACYIQALCRMLMVEQPFKPTEDDYLVYNFNRFQACRFGLDATIVDPKSHEHRPIRDDMLATLTRIEQHAIELGGDVACTRLRQRVRDGITDARWCRERYAHYDSMNELARAQAEKWMRE